MTLIAIYTNDGCVGRCDARCYNARSKTCDCICGGKNHGAGQQKAIENTRDMFEEWTARYAQEKGLTDYRMELSNDVAQLSLF